MKTNEDKETYPYANHFRVGYNAFEFIIEVGVHYEDEDDPTYHTRITMHPGNVEELIDVLQKSHADFKKSYNYEL